MTKPARRASSPRARASSAPGSSNSPGNMTSRSRRTRCWRGPCPMARSATKFRPTSTRRSPKCWSSCCGCRGGYARRVRQKFPLSMLCRDAIRLAFLNSSDKAVINRRHALGLLTAASILPNRSFANVSYQRSEFRDDLSKRFFDPGPPRTSAAYKGDDYLIIASDKVRSGEGKLPASTFKIPNSVIALETGVVEDPDKDVFKWDGETRSIEAWNKDHTLRSAIAVSAVPVYQEIARRIGVERMQKYVDLFDYGNRDIGGGIDQFWLTGNLRIDPVQQIDFVDRLRRGVLPGSKRSQELTRDILPVTKVGDATIRAKSGLLGAEQGKPSLGWMVGWVEKGSSATVFAMNMDCKEQSHIAARMTVVQQCLADIVAY